MSRAFITEQYLTDIANAIRTVDGKESTTKYTPKQMADAIKNIKAVQPEEPEYKINIETIG